MIDSKSIPKGVRRFKSDPPHYHKGYFPDFQKEFMLRTPIARQSKTGSSTNPFRDLQDIKQDVKNIHSINLTIVANKDFLDAIEELRAVAAKRTDQMNSPIMRFLQIEEQLKKYFGPTRPKSNQNSTN